ncbi:hypothetical protein [Neptuniibacter sp. QD34_54]|uniref:hypothetical protein n=1 Tax=Neptuniibacter sp. QD34_54 TaxID=3398208 RepID=UPI0039F50B47
MKRLTSVILLLIFNPIYQANSAEIYSCIVDGRKAFRDEPCDGDKITLQPVNSIQRRNEPNSNSSSHLPPKDSLVRPPLAQIDLYYFATRKHDASMLKTKLQKHHYLVNLISASSADFFKRKDAMRPSYLYFQDHEYQKMLVLKRLVEKNLGHPIIANISKRQYRAKNRIFLALTNHE